MTTELWEKEDDRLAEFYNQKKLGDIVEPAVIIDCYGRILDWHLLDVLLLVRTVSLLPDILQHHLIVYMLL